MPAAAAGVRNARKGKSGLSLCFTYDCVPAYSPQCLRGPSSQGMFCLSEQEEGGVGSVPKLFLAAQRDAVCRKQATSDNALRHDDDDVQVVQHLCVSGRPASTTEKKDGVSTPAVECVDLT